jgi:hypothetical protein
MSKGDTYENDLLKLCFQATSIADICTTTGTANLTIALHTADPGATPETGTQLTSEATYTGYARISVPRTTGGWTVTGNSVSPVANIDFGLCTAGTNTITHFSVGTGTANKLLYSGTVLPNISVANGVIPRLTTGSTITED